MPAWLGSLRFRLTAFYTVLLATVIVSLAVSLSVILERQLEEDLDKRLADTVEQFNELIERTGPTKIRPPLEDLDPISSGSTFVQFTNIDGESFTSSNLGNSRLPLHQRPDGKDLDEPVYTSETVDGVELRILTSPYYTEDFFSDGLLFGGYVTVATSREPLGRTVDLLQRLLLYGSVIGIGGAAVGGWLLASRALRPIDRITATAAHIARSGDRSVDLSARLDEPHANDEVSRLARTFNSMLDRLETAFVAQRRFLADASHELRTPLTAIRGNADVLRRQAETWTAVPDKADALAALDDVRREAERMSRLVSDLLLLARSDAPVSTANHLPVRLDTIAAEAVRTAGALANGQHLEFTGSATTVVADPDQLRQLVIILLDNALRHTAADGMIRVSTGLNRAHEPELSVQDNGEGIAPEHLPHIFERFYRADTARARATGGTGLGLAIARVIAGDHNAKISVESTLGAGSTFRVTFKGAD
jgi:two-component system OmpR family sensor kinase